MKSNLVSPIEMTQQMNKTLMLSSRQLNWNGILVEQYQAPSTPGEVELPALSDHWLKVPLGQPDRLTQRRDDRPSEVIVQKGDSILIPAGQPSRWHCPRSATPRPTLNIYLKPELIRQVAEASGIEQDSISLVKHFAQHDFQLQQLAMLLFAELRSGGMMGQLYVESLSQALVIHLLRHYSTIPPTHTLHPAESRSLTQSQLQQATDYIHTHLDRELSLAQIASVLNLSPTYFASLFKRATGLPPHQYVIKHRVKRAKSLLTKTDLPIPDIALQVGFSSQSHLTQQFKRFTGMTPKQVR